MSHYNSSMEEIHQEMQLLSFAAPPHIWPRASSARFNHFDGPSLDLQLSISVTPLKPPNNASDTNNCVLNIGDYMSGFSNDSIEVLKWQASEQIRMAAMERAYAERLMEMTRREMEMAQLEFKRAHSLWTRAREDADKAEKMKERAFGVSADSMCMEITCLCCRNKFRQ